MRAYIDEKVSRQVSQIRAARSYQLLAARYGQVTVRWMMRIARGHYEDTFLESPYFDAADPDFQSICMHVSPAGFTWGNTASSCIAVLPKSPQELPVFWWTPCPPCNGCYMPFLSTEVNCLISYPALEHLVRRGPHLPELKRMNSLLIHIGGYLDDLWIE